MLIPATVVNWTWPGLHRITAEDGFFCHGGTGGVLYAHHASSSTNGYYLIDKLPGSRSNAVIAVTNIFRRLPEREDGDYFVILKGASP